MMRAVQPEMMLMKAAIRMEQAPSTRSSLKPKTADLSPGFADILGNMKLTKGLPDDPKAFGLKKLRAALMKVLKQSSTGIDPAKMDPKDAQHILKMLKTAVDLLRNSQIHFPQNSTIKRDDLDVSELDFLQSAIEQWQQLFLPQKMPEEAHSPSPDAKKVRHFIVLLVKSIDHFMQDPSLLRETASRGRQTKKLSSSFVSVQPENIQKGMTDGKQGVLQKLGRSPVTHVGKALANHASGQSLTAFIDAKNVAVSALRNVTSQSKVHTQMTAGGFQPGPMHQLQQFVIHVRQNGASLNQSQFVRDFQKILAKGTLTNVGGKQQLTIQLHPQHLGTLNVQLTRQNGQLTATLTAFTNTAKNLVESNLHHLQGAFINQNLNVQKLQVVLPNGQSQGQTFYEQHEQQHDSRNHDQPETGQQDDESNDEEGMNFMEWLNQQDPRREVER